MPRILLVADQVEAFEELARSLDREGTIDVHWAHDDAAALERVAADTPDLVVVDATIGDTNGLDWIRRLVGVNAFVQTAVVSRLPHEAFHEAAEGLGIMAQLPPRPGKNDAQRVVKALRLLSGVD